MRRPIVLAAILTQSVMAQQPVAPTPESAGRPRGQDVSGYNVVNSLETGYRFSLIDGDLGKYRSDVNYRNGIRLLGSNLTINSRDGHGPFFDEIVLNTLGLGNDPYQSAILRIQKNGLYRYDMTWRLDEYFNPGLRVSFGEHLMDTRRRLQDHDLILFPQWKFKFRLGYTRNSQTGPALDTTHAFDIRGDEFPLFKNIRRLRNEFRAGGDIELKGIKLTFLHRWDNFKEDTPYQLDGSTAGNNPQDLTALSSFRRAEPYHGSSPAWLANLYSDRKRWAANGRFTYAGGRRNFILDETTAGIDRFGSNRNRQVFVRGNARRPVATGDFAFSFFPTERLTLVNNTSVHSTRIDGDAAYTEFNNATQSANTVYFQYLGIRTITNSTDAQYRVRTWAGLYGGYRYSTRRIRSIEDFTIPPFPPDQTAFEQTNHVHSGVAGLRVQLFKPLTVNFDAEIDRADRPFYPISDRHYHALGARAQFKHKNILITTSYRQNYNNNPVSISSYSSHSRNYSADASWVARGWLSFDAGYSKLHLDTVSGLSFFAGTPRPQLIAPGNYGSLYFSSIHAGNLGLRVELKKRTSLYAGYSITRDTGDGRQPLSPAAADPVSALLVPVQSFPLSFQSPLARLSVKINNRLRWNAGWQFYRYREDFAFFSAQQNYRAHTGYTSLLWSF